MKHFKLLLFFAIASIFASCETPKSYFVNIRHEILSGNVIMFIAEAKGEPVNMFYWWVSKDDKNVLKKPTESLLRYDGEWEYIYSDTITIQAESGGTYKAVLRYYDTAYEAHYAEDVVSIP